MYVASESDAKIMAYFGVMRAAFLTLWYKYIYEGHKLERLILYEDKCVPRGTPLRKMTTLHIPRGSSGGLFQEAGLDIGSQSQCKMFWTDLHNWGDRQPKSGAAI